MSDISFSKQQQKCVDYEGGDLLIKGVAGSGKSFVILGRAAKTVQKYPDAKVAIFTFQNTLVTYTKSLLNLRLPEDAITVQTVDSYCLDLYRTMTRKYYFSIKSIDRELVEKVLELHQEKTLLDHRLYDKDVDFWIDEFNWIRGKCIKTKEGYLAAERTGRGSQVRVTRTDRELIWGAYEVLLAQMRSKGITDWNEIYIYLNDNVSRIPADKKYDYVFIDEAQDMTLGKMKTLKAIAKNRITIAADLAQKIHKSSFTWKEVGLDFTGGASKTLSKSFRSTKQIVLLAEDLMKENRLTAPNNDDYTEAVLPEIDGPMPILCKFKSAYLQNGYIEKLLKEIDLSTKRVGIIVYSSNELKTIQKTLYVKGIKYQTIEPSTQGWNILEPGVKLVKAHSSKGLEFDFVIIPYLTDSVFPYKPDKTEDDAMEEYLRQQRSILYVAMTRAKIGLSLLTIRGSESRFIESFDKEHYEVKYL